VKKVFFNSADKRLNIGGRLRIRDFIEEIFKKENKDLKRLDYVFCSDNYLLEINKQFLNHNYFTDIITFDLSEKKGPVIGEIYLSVDRVKLNAVDYDTSMKKELLRVIFHGALHLCGYKDKKKADMILIRKKEDEYLYLFLDK